MSNTNESIYHHGIPGMKWGVRRFQNKDGSLTLAGRKKAQKLKEDYKKLTGKKLKGKIPDDPSKKKLRELSPTQLKERLGYLQNLKKAHDIEEELIYSKGHKFVRSIGKNVLAPAAIDAGRSVMQKIFYNAMAKATGLDAKDIKKSSNEIKKEIGDSFKDVKKEFTKQKNNTENNDSQNNKDKTNINNYFIFNSKTNERAANEGKNIYKNNDFKETKWHDKPSNNSTSLLPYNSNVRKKGKDIIEDLYN